jgi:hypothetical protein
MNGREQFVSRGGKQKERSIAILMGALIFSAKVITLQLG